MAVYAIGDIQGCYDALRRLLDALAFDPGKDQVWFTGDLVNRGPHSLDTLRFVRQLGVAAVTVLGNHDLHLLAVASSHRKPHRKDTLDEILSAADSEELLDWLRFRPLLHSDGRFCLVHAGLPPQWDLATAQACAGEVEAVLRSKHYQAFFPHMYGDQPDAWSEQLTGWGRLRYITNCLTRLRYCQPDGRLELHSKMAPTDAPGHLIPWFAMPQRRSRGLPVIFGHWSTLGFYAADACYGLDTGCLWGGELTALRLDHPAMAKTSVACCGALSPSQA